MRDELLVILRRLYDAGGGRVGYTVQLPDASASHIDALTGEGLILKGEGNFISLTSIGLRTLWEESTRAARKAERIPCVSFGKRQKNPIDRRHELLEIEEIMAVVGRQGGSDDEPLLADNDASLFVPRAPQHTGSHLPAAGDVRLTNLRAELDRLRQDLLSAGSLETKGWSKTLEESDQIEQAITRLESALANRD